MRLIYHPDAEAELVEAAQFYEGRVSNLGAEFLDAVNRAIHHIQEEPVSRRFVEAGGSYLPNAPLSLFHLLPRLVRTDPILALKHHSRHPDYWRHRLAS